MKLVASIVLAFIGCFSLNEAIAQKTASATMTITVTIVNGVSLSKVEQINIDLENNTINGGQLDFTIPSYIDTDIEVQDTILLKNEFGDEVLVHTDSFHKVDNKLHNVKLNPQLAGIENELRGTFKGVVVTTVNYL